MESGQSITQKELWDIVFWKPCNFSRKRPALKGDRNWRPIDFLLAKVLRFSRLRRKSNKGKSQKVGVINKVTPIKKLKKGRPMFCPGLSRMGRLVVLFSKAVPGTCSICGERDVNSADLFCPFNYMYGRYHSESCRAECPPGHHTITSMARRRFLQCYVRVNNMPPGFTPRDLRDLFRPFGRLLMWDVPSFSGQKCSCFVWPCRGYGSVVFREREDAERAIDELNGYHVRGHKLRVDWVYPCF